MLQTLSLRYRRPVAGVLSAVIYMQFLSPLFSPLNGRAERLKIRIGSGDYSVLGRTQPLGKLMGLKDRPARLGHSMGPVGTESMHDQMRHSGSSPMAIGGPGSPEASSFKAVGADNLVNLFTGDFSYSIPLLDVDGYPVNLFYNGGISMEQEASWVGLGWNINPGSVSRNMRGVPDDFDGTDTLKQTQAVKPNKTWGGEVSADAELFGWKTPNVNFSLGYSYNNYLGPELELGAGVAVNIPMPKTEMHEKAAPLLGSQGLATSFGVNAKLSSRSGLTLMPSLNAGLHAADHLIDLGVGISTSYNSRTGIKDLDIHSQMSINRYSQENKNYGPHITNLFHSDVYNSTISFARPSYMPTLRMPMQYSHKAGQIEVGFGMYGARGAGTLQGYYIESKVADGSTTIYKPLVGFLYLDKANGHRDAVMDFNRLNDGEVTPNTPVISAPQYDYDVFSIQGEGTGGSIRAYRGDMGFMRDQLTTSKDDNVSIGMDYGYPGHLGGNDNGVTTPTRSGNWDDANNTLNQTLLFTGAKANSSFENVYFRNPGEATVTNDLMIGNMGKDNLVRFKLDGSNVTPRLESQLELFSKRTGIALGTLAVANANANAKISPQRDKRSQIVTMLTADDASRIGLEDSIRSYLPTLDDSNNLQYRSIARSGGFRKGHHISEITVLESSGMRYVYGLPVYSTVQRDFSFSVVGIGDAATNLVTYSPDNEPTTASTDIGGQTGVDGYVNVQQTPAYASAFLITGLLSPDYVDVTGNGITEDDLGRAVKFDYTLSDSIHRWRTPRSQTDGSANIAHFNIGLKTEKRDDKATISYGEREAWYLHAIESKSMIAIFSTSSRHDAKGVKSDLDGSIDTAEQANMKLDSISLYTKADLKAHGLSGALPLKTVHFEYNYSLCHGTPDNYSGGKLTLHDIYFTFNGQARSSKDMYLFDYGDTSSYYHNAPYAYDASDRWGTYKPMTDSSGAAVNPNGLSNIDYPYTSTNKAADDQYAGEWALKKILLPSGGQMEIQYEADDYAYVQDRRACNMFNLYGLGSSPDYVSNNMLHPIYFSNQDQNYAYIQLPIALTNTDAVHSKAEILAKYLQGIKQVAFKLAVNMPKGIEPLTVYAGIDDYGLCPNSTDGTMIYLKLTPVDGKGPLANAAVQFLINSLPGQAFPGYDLSGDTGLEAFFQLITSELHGLFNAYSSAETQVRSAGLGGSVSLANSFVRLNSPTFFKYGGGHRVKRIIVKDNWNTMSGQYNSQYGQDYDYTTTADVDGVQTAISSGVASYEPGIGSEENPFREILQFEDKLPLASAQYGAIEMPTLEGLYPAPVVGYSKVTVRSIHRNGTHGDSVVRSAIGKQVSEFYTAKDFPSYSAYTPMTNVDYHKNPGFNFLSKETIDHRTTSQGFLVETNDMHGKMKRQAVYSESDGNTPLSYTLYAYKNTGANGLNDVVDFVHNDQGGALSTGNMGVDMELMTDVREFSVISTGDDKQLQVDFFSFTPPVFTVVLWPVESYTENVYRAVTTTKLINYHAILDSTIINDKGSTVTTKTMAYDAETGQPLVTKTLNEFNDPVYNTTLPAYWAYSGMAPAYKNINMKFSAVDFSDGRIVGGVSDMSVFESGDELFIDPKAHGMGIPSGTCVPESPCTNKLWAFDKNKNSTALTVPVSDRDLVFMDSAGRPFTKAGVTFRIVRSGKRNDLGLTAGTVTSMINPIRMVSGVRQLVIDDADNVVAATAAAFKEKWQNDDDAMPKTTVTVVDCISIESPDCNGTRPTHINPYLRGLVGNFKPYRSYTYYGSRAQTDPSVNTKIRTNGYISGFGSYWVFDSNYDLVPDYSNTNWVWNSELTKVNAKGQELETRDALNRYTAAQYGFAKNLPVAMVQNSRYGLAFNEGFEDYYYSETLNKSSTFECDSSKYISFSGLTHSAVLNTDTLSFKAHTGRYALEVDPSSQAVKPLLVQPSIVDSFNFNWKTEDATVLVDQGGNVNDAFATPSYATDGDPASTAIFSNGGFGTEVTANNTQTDLGGGNYNYAHSFGFTMAYYIQVPASGTYQFELDLGASDNGFPGSSTDHANMALSIYDLSSTLAGSANLSSDDGITLTYNVLLCKGIYQVVTVVGDNASFNSTVSGFSIPTSYTFSLATNAASMDYKDLTSSSCTFTDPIPVTDSMFNAHFALVPGEQVQFSAWVREDCGNTAGTPCYLTQYSNDHIIVQFPGSSILSSLSLYPQGVIVEGWQRIDGSFTVPSDATSANLVLSNDGSHNIYFDDIRIHPFNADMKSYVYDPRTLRLMAELDENNYASFYNYDEEGQLVRVKKETMQGIKTIKEVRSAKQKTIKDIQP